MEPTWEKLQQFCRSAAARHSRNCYSPHGIFKPSKLQRPSLKWRKDHLPRGKRKVPYRKNDEVRKKTPEEAEEEERKKKLVDTANTLLSKIKTWNAENTIAGEKPEETSQKGEESSKCEKTTRQSPKPRRIAHLKSVNSGEIVKKVPKTRTATRYDVNKETLKDFQNRIQHKLIEDIMQMPRENLQNMLNDPKINPIMEVKMTSLVRENKPLIAKKLRDIAEHKMKSSGSSQILLDFDKLIDPVIETDLSALPYELIKEMEKVFQVQFDYSPQEVELVGSEVMECESLERVKENTEDVNAYECSTDDDEESKGKEVLSRELISDFGAEPPQTPSGSVNKKRKTAVCCQAEKSKVTLVASQSQTDLCTKESTATQTQQRVETVSTQTDTMFLYGVPLPVEAKDNSYSSLMEEVNSIQNLINKLNEKRFNLFLQLARMNPTCNFNYLGNKNFIETVSNGSISLIESLTRVFRVPNYEQSRSNPRVRCNKQRNYPRQDKRK